MTDTTPPKKPLTHDEVIAELSRPPKPLTDEEILYNNVKDIEDIGVITALKMMQEARRSQDQLSRAEGYEIGFAEGSKDFEDVANQRDYYADKYDKGADNSTYKEFLARRAKELESATLKERERIRAVLEKLKSNYSDDEPSESDIMSGIDVALKAIGGE